MLAIFYRIILVQIMIVVIFFGILSYLSLNYTLGNSKELSSVYKSNGDYSYYVLAGQKWCSHEYQLHGLWPQFSHNDWPSNCKKVSYTEPSGQLLEDMNKYWSSCNDNNNLWKHEWVKHGSCVEQQYGLGENVLGSPILALKWLLNELLEFKIPLKQGHFVSTGTVTKPIPIKKGDIVKADYSDLGNFQISLN